MMKMIMKPSKMGDLGPSNGNVLTILKAVQQKKIVSEYFLTLDTTKIKEQLGTSNNPVGL